MTARNSRNSSTNVREVLRNIPKPNPVAVSFYFEVLSMIILRSEHKKALKGLSFFLKVVTNKYAAVAENYMHPKDKKQIKKLLVLKS